MVMMYWYIIFVLDSGPPKGSLNSLGGHPVIIRCYISKSWFPDRFTTWVEEGDGQQTLLKRRSSSFLLLLLLSPPPWIINRRHHPSSDTLRTNNESLAMSSKATSFFNRLCNTSHCSKSSFFVQKFNFDLPRKIVQLFWVKMLRFWTF